MLEDQLNQIAHLKAQIADREEDVRELVEAKSKHRDYYEDKLGVEIDATERAKAKLEDANQRLLDLEEECDNLRHDNGALTDQVQHLQGQVREKDSVLEFVETEIQKIRDKQD